MNPSEYCLANHLYGDSNPTLRFCKFCRKAMCEQCYDKHLVTCTRHAHSENEEANSAIHSMPPKKKLKKNDSPHSKATTDKPLYSFVNGGQNKQYLKCSIHHMDAMYFCSSHCHLICQQCHETRHNTCDVKTVTETCNILGHTSVGEYRKWLNKLRVDSIQVKSMLSKNVTGLKTQKDSALKELESEYLKVTDRFNAEFDEAKSDITDRFDKFNVELCAYICHLNALITRLDTSLDNSRILEGRNLDFDLFVKLQNILFENLDLPSDLENLYKKLSKTKLTFKSNKRFQPLSPNSKLGCVSVTTTKLKIDTLPELRFPVTLPKSVDNQSQSALKQLGPCLVQTTTNTLNAKLASQETTGQVLFVAMSDQQTNCDVGSHTAGSGENAVPQGNQPVGVRRKSIFGETELARNDCEVTDLRQCNALTRNTERYIAEPMAVAYGPCMSGQNIMSKNNEWINSKNIVRNDNGESLAGNMGRTAVTHGRSMAGSNIISINNKCNNTKNIVRNDNGECLAGNMRPTAVTHGRSMAGSNIISINNKCNNTKNIVRNDNGECLAGNMGPTAVTHGRNKADSNIISINNECNNTKNIARNDNGESLAGNMGPTAVTHGRSMAGSNVISMSNECNNSKNIARNDNGESLAGNMGPTAVTHGRSMAGSNIISMSNECNNSKNIARNDNGESLAGNMGQAIFGMHKVGGKSCSLTNTAEQNNRRGKILGQSGPREEKPEQDCPSTFGHDNLKRPNGQIYNADMDMVDETGSEDEVAIEQNNVVVENVRSWPAKESHATYDERSAIADIYGIPGLCREIGMDSDNHFQSRLGNVTYGVPKTVTAQRNEQHICMVPTQSQIHKISKDVHIRQKTHRAEAGTGRADQTGIFLKEQTTGQSNSVFMNAAPNGMQSELRPSCNSALKAIPGSSFSVHSPTRNLCSVEGFNVISPMVLADKQTDFLTPHWSQSNIDQNSSSSGTKTKNLDTLTFHSLDPLPLNEQANMVESRDPLPKGLAVTCDGRISLCYFFKSIVDMLSVGREWMSSLNLYEFPRGVTMYDDTTAIATGEYKLFFIDISGCNLKLKKSVELNFDPCAITLCDRNLLVTCGGVPFSIKLITVSGKIKWSVSRDTQGEELCSYDSYITCYRHEDQCRVAVTNCETETITILDGDTGAVIKVCKEGLEGKWPSSITTDKNGNIYVYYTNTGEIAIWNREMTKSKVVIKTDRDEICGIAFDSSRNQLVVAGRFTGHIDTYQLCS